MKRNKLNLLSGQPLDVKDALLKKALGYDAQEVVEEYSLSNEGEIVLSKKKVTVKNVPPDTTAIKMLLDDNLDDISAYTDDELYCERNKLLAELGALTDKDVNIKKEKVCKKK